MLQYYLRQLGAAREGVGEGLAVSDVDESDADARLVEGAKNLQSRMLIESAADSWGNLQSRISFASDADACILKEQQSWLRQRLIHLTSETASFWP